MWYEWTFVSKMIRIFEFSNIRHTLIEYNFDTNEYPNIFVSRKWYERISEYIRIKKLIWTNVRIDIRTENIRIFKYIRHTLVEIKIYKQNKLQIKVKFFFPIFFRQVCLLLSDCHQKSLRLTISLESVKVILIDHTSVTEFNQI